jgi:hypothetical protein
MNRGCGCLDSFEITSMSIHSLEVGNNDLHVSILLLYCKYGMDDDATRVVGLLCGESEAAGLSRRCLYNAFASESVHQVPRTFYLYIHSPPSSLLPLPSSHLLRLRRDWLHLSLKQR